MAGESENVVRHRHGYEPDLASHPIPLVPPPFDFPPRVAQGCSEPEHEGA